MNSRSDSLQRNGKEQKHLERRIKIMKIPKVIFTYENHDIYKRYLRDIYVKNYFCKKKCAHKYIYIYICVCIHTYTKLSEILCFFSCTCWEQLKKNNDRFNIETSIDKILKCEKRAFY